MIIFLKIRQIVILVCIDILMNLEGWYMKYVTVCLEHRFFEYNDNLYTSLAFPYFYWQDYLNYFDKVIIVARVKKISKIEDGMTKVSGKNVDFIPLPYYIGVKEFLKKFPSLTFALLKVAKSNSHFLLRSGNSTNILFFFLLLLNKPYIREYPGNIKEGVIGFAGESFKVKILASILDAIAKVQSRFSKANSFVSQYCCNLYGSHKANFIFSSFKASEIAVVKNNYEIKDSINIVSVGRLEGEKGHINMLKSIKSLPNFQVHIIGDGNQRDNLEKYAAENNIDAIFYGSVTDREKLFKIFREADLFLIPSFTEGMPRALLEAMTIGLPCVGTNVGGIPEVLESKSLYEPNDIQTLQKMLIELSTNESQRSRMGERNKLFIEKNYSDAALSERKQKFWSKLYE